MFAYLKTLSPNDRAQEIAEIQALLEQDPTALVPLYRDNAMQQVSRDASQSMVVSITGITVGAILAGAFIGFPLALTAGTLILTQQFWNGQRSKREARWAIEDGEDFTRFLDRDTQREYKHFAAAVKETHGHVLPHSAAKPESAIDVDAATVNEAQSHGIVRNASELLALLQSQCPDLLLLVKAAPIRLVGKQRTGKSTFARKLALLRSILLPGHSVIWATPHRETDNPVPESLNPFGVSASGAKNMGAIESVWEAVQDAIDAGQPLNLTAVWDEFGSYDGFEHADLLGGSLRSLLREATKHGYFPVLVAHGDQASFYPGVKNILSTLHTGTVKVETIGRVSNAFGEMAPTGAVQVTWLDGSQVSIALPAWLTLDLLLSLQPVVDRPAVLQALVSLPKQPPQSMSPAPHIGVEDAPKQTEETIQQRVSKKLREKLQAASPDWTKERELVTRAFTQDEERFLAKKILAAAIAKGLIEREAVAHPNGTETIQYRLKAKGLANSN